MNGKVDTKANAKQPWPVMDRAAYHGLVGDLVNTISPHSESDPVAILIQFLIAGGSMAGRSIFYQVEGDRHHPNLFATMVGASSKARKGTSWGRVTSVAKLADPAWAENCCKGGLSSGEGLINEVRDSDQKFNAKTHEWEEVDPGVPDKRLMIVEPEFAGALAVMERHGNTLSMLIRKGWDGSKLQTMTRNSPLKSTGAHISIIGHITEDELRARLTKTDTANGFANRFIFPLVKRSRLLPFGGSLNDGSIVRLSEKLCATLRKLPDQSSPVRVTMDAAAREFWTGIYGALSADRPGMVGAITARAEAQTVRLAMIYAMLDGSSEIDVAHLKAALAVWEYCEASAAHIFGSSLGDHVADDIVRALKSAGEDGLTRNAIRDLFSRHQSSERIGAALELLKKQGLVRMDKLETGGRPVELWFYCAESAESAERK